METYIQQVDIKEGCELYYSDKFISNLPKEKEYVTWKDFETSAKKDIEYAWLKTLGNPLQEVLPAELNSSYMMAKKPLLAHYKALKEAKVDLELNCFFDIIPPSMTQEYFRVKNEVTKYVWEEVSLPPGLYDTLKRAHILSKNCNNSSLLFDKGWVQKNSFSRETRSCKKFLTKNSVDYNIFGTITGRFTTKKESFPILTLNRPSRRMIIPKNDLFLVFDYNAAEARVMSGLLGLEQPDIDVHEYHSRLLGRGRDAAKKAFFSWLYDPRKKNQALDSAYDRRSLMKNHYSNGEVTTPYGRIMKTTEDKSLNYLLQSTTNDMVVEKFYEVLEFLTDKKSLISFVIHDSVVIDASLDDKRHFRQIKTILQNTRYGKMHLGTSVGKNMRDLRKI